jgi:hypothetical protein
MTCVMKRAPKTTAGTGKRDSIPGRNNTFLSSPKRPDLTLGHHQTHNQWSPGLISPGGKASGAWSWPLASTTTLWRRKKYLNRPEFKLQIVRPVAKSPHWLCYSGPHECFTWNYEILKFLPDSYFPFLQNCFSRTYVCLTLTHTHTHTHTHTYIYIYIYTYTHTHTHTHTNISHVAFRHSKQLD